MQKSGKYGVERPELVNERLPAAELSKNAPPADVSAFRTIGTLWGWVHLPSPSKHGPMNGADTLGHQPIHEGAACADGITPSPLHLHISDNIKLALKGISAPSPLWLLGAGKTSQEFTSPIPTEKQNPHTITKSKDWGYSEHRSSYPRQSKQKAENQMCRFQGLKTWRPNQ